MNTTKMMLFLGIFGVLMAIGSQLLLTADVHGLMEKINLRNKIPDSLDMFPAHQHPMENMKAVVYRQHGDASQLEYTDVPRPVPQATQYLIKIEASALNPVDYKMRRNSKVPEFLIPLPKIPGADVAGVVLQTPCFKNPDDCKFRVGDRVAALLPVLSHWGAHAELVAVEERFLAKMGDQTSFLEAASYPLAGLTVLQNMANLEDKPQPNDKLLVHAGAGGVGTFAIQYASKVLGMKVATTASAPKAELLKDLGADTVVDYRNQAFEEVLEGYDVVLDPMSWLYEERSLKTKVLKPTGHYLNVPSSDAAFVDGVERANGLKTYLNAATHSLRNWWSPGSTAKYGLVFVHPDGNDLQKVLDLMESGKIKAVIDKTYHVTQAQEAYRYLEEGHATGKVVLYHGEEQSPEADASTQSTEEGESTPL